MKLGKWERLVLLSVSEGERSYQFLRMLLPESENRDVIFSQVINRLIRKGLVEKWWIISFGGKIVPGTSNPLGKYLPATITVTSSYKPYTELGYVLSNRGYDVVGEIVPEKEE